MTDQCKHCACIGNMEACLSTNCFHHENWYAKEQTKAIKELASALKAAADNLRIWGSVSQAKHYEALANKYLDNTPPIKNED